jgi:hypothetical protein
MLLGPVSGTHPPLIPIPRSLIFSIYMKSCYMQLFAQMRFGFRVNDFKEIE